MNSERYWSALDLTEALLVQSLEQFKPLVDKLRDGKPITVVARGGRLVQDFGGCHQPPGFSTPPAVRVPPFAYLNNRCNMSPSGGWLALFMQRLVTAFPGAPHSLVNAAYYGNRHLGDSSEVCAELHLPPAADLLLWDNEDGVTPGYALEGATWRALQRAFVLGRPRPAIIVVNSVAPLPALQPRGHSRHPQYVIAGGENVTTSTAAAALAANADGVGGGGGAGVARSGGNATWRDCLEEYGLRQPAGSSGARQVALRQAATQLVAGDGYRRYGFEQLAAQVGRYYGLTVVSLRQFLWVMLRDGVVRSRRWSACQLLGSIYRAPLEPTPLGQVLYADLLVNLLGLAVRHAEEYPATRPPGVPPKALWPAARAPGAPLPTVSRCYLLDSQFVFEPGANSKPGSSQEPVQPAIVKSKGWAYETTDPTAPAAAPHAGGAGSAPAPSFEPGWWSEEPGSVLAIKIDSRFSAEQASLSFVSRLSLHITYLASPVEPMGGVRVACRGGCQCLAEIDGHTVEPPQYAMGRAAAGAGAGGAAATGNTTGGGAVARGRGGGRSLLSSTWHGGMQLHNQLMVPFKTRLHAKHVLSITPSSDCEVRLRVRKETWSGGRRIKVLGLAVVSEQLKPRYGSGSPCQELINATSSAPPVLAGVGRMRAPGWSGGLARYGMPEELLAALCGV